MLAAGAQGLRAAALANAALDCHGAERLTERNFDYADPAGRW